MNAKFLQSWKGAILISTVLLTLITGYKIAFGPDAATRIAEVRLRNAFPNGEPTAEVMDRPVVVGLVRTDTGYTLRELVALAKEAGQLAIEAVEPNLFVLRYAERDPLTLFDHRVAFEVRTVDGPGDFQPGYANFNSKAVSVERIIFDDLEYDPMQRAVMMMSFRPEIEARRSPSWP